jgi:hypothetical protein
MREFKLIKKYPSLPSDWEVGMVVGIRDRNIDYSPCNSKYFDFRISNREVEKFPEFWEEVVEQSSNKIYNNPNFDAWKAFNEIIENFIKSS